MIALLILVVAIAFGFFKTKESMTTEDNVMRELYVPYHESRALVRIHSVLYTENRKQHIYFDEMYGNLIIAPEVPELKTNTVEFQVVNRNGESQKYSAENGKQPANLKRDLSNMSTIKQITSDNSGKSTNVSWSYGEKGFGVVYVTWDAYTNIYVLNTFDHVMGPVYQSVYTPTYAHTSIDHSIEGSPLMQKDTNTSNYSADPNTIVPIRDYNAYQITKNVYFNFNRGLIIRKPTGFDMTEISASSGSSVEYDNINNAMVIGTKLQKNGVRSAILIVLSYTSSDLVSPYQLFTTARIANNDENKPNYQYPFDRKYPMSETNDAANPNYILKTEIVPPVCPMCPSPCEHKYPTTTPPTPTPTRCGVSVNNAGQFVDCSGTVITLPPAPTTTPVATSAGTFGGAISSSVKSISDAAGSAVSTVGNVADTAISTAGGLVGQAGTDVTNIATGLGTDITKLGTGVIGGATTLGSEAVGLVGQTVGTAGSLVGKTIDSATGLAYGAGTGIANMMHPTNVQGQLQYGTQGQYGYQPQYGYPGQYGYPAYQGAPVYPGYYGGPGQQICGPPSYPAQTSDFMPITNDFSQFA